MKTRNATRGRRGKQTGNGADSCFSGGGFEATVEEDLNGRCGVVTGFGHDGGENIWALVVVEVGEGHRGVLWNSGLNTVSGEGLTGDLFEPDEGLQLFRELALDCLFGEDCGGGDIEVSILIKIPSKGSVHTWHCGDALRFEAEFSLVGEQPDAVERLDDFGIEGVSGCVEQIEVAIAVKVDSFNSAGAPRRVWGCEQANFFKAIRSTQKGVNNFVFLADQGDEVESSVAVEVAHRGVNAARPRVDLFGAKLVGSIWGSSFIPEHMDSAGGVPAEFGDDEIEVTIGVEISRPHISDSPDISQQHHWLGTGAEVGNPEHLSAVMISGQWAAEVGDEQVLLAVLIEVREA